MNLLPSIASIANLFTRPLPTFSHHRYTHLVIGDATTITPTTSVATATVDSATTVVASVPTFVPDWVPTLHPNFTLPIALDTGASISRTSDFTLDITQASNFTLPIALDTGASISRTSDFTLDITQASNFTLPIALDTGASISRTSDFTLDITQASYGLIRSPISDVSKALASKALASTPVDPYTLITGEDAIDLSSSDLALNSNSVETAASFTKVSFDIRQFGTASLTFIYSKSTSELLHIFVDPTQIDWLHWFPLPRLILPESYFHIFGLDYLHAFTLLHLIPIWIYCLLHFAVNLED